MAKLEEIKMQREMQAQMKAEDDEKKAEALKKRDEILA